MGLTYQPLVDAAVTLLERYSEDLCFCADEEYQSELRLQLPEALEALLPYVAAAEVSSKNWNSNG